MQMFVTLTYSYFSLHTRLGFHSPLPLLSYCKSTPFPLSPLNSDVLTMSIDVRQNFSVLDSGKLNDFHWNDHRNNDINSLLLFILHTRSGHLQWWLWFTCQNEHKIIHMLTTHSSSPLISQRSPRLSSQFYPSQTTYKVLHCFTPYSIV